MIAESLCHDITLTLIVDHLSVLYLIMSYLSIPTPNTDCESLTGDYSLQQNVHATELKLKIKVE